MASLTETHACGLVAEPGDAAALADRLMTFYNDRNLMRRAGENARGTALAFDRRLQVSRYAEVFGAVAARTALVSTPATGTSVARRI